MDSRFRGNDGLSEYLVANPFICFCNKRIEKGSLQYYRTKRIVIPAKAGIQNGAASNGTCLSPYGQANRHSRESGNPERIRVEQRLLTPKEPLIK